MFDQLKWENIYKGSNEKIALRIKLSSEVDVLIKPAKLLFNAQYLLVEQKSTIFTVINFILALVNNLVWQ